MLKKTLIISIFLSLVGCEEKKIEFHRIDKYTEISTDSTRLSEVYVILNIPKDTIEFLKEVSKFQSIPGKGRNKQYETHYRLYLKEHYESASDKMMGEKTRYFSKNPAELNNADFIYRVHWFKTKRGKDTVTHHFYGDRYNL